MMMIRSVPSPMYISRPPFPGASGRDYPSGVLGNWTNAQRRSVFLNQFPLHEPLHDLAKRGGI
jgi:hypothetical protein